MKMLEFGRVASSDPIDRTASVVTGPGEHWDPERPQHWPARSYDAPPATVASPSWCPDLTGQRYGRVAVLGLLKATERNGWSLWLVRCQCGAYEDRTGRGIVSNAGPMCWRCDRLRRLQEGRDPEPAAPRPRPGPRSAAEPMLTARSARWKRPAEGALGAAFDAAFARKIQQT